MNLAMEDLQAKYDNLLRVHHQCGTSSQASGRDAASNQTSGQDRADRPSGASSSEELEKLKERITNLEEENEDLKKQIPKPKTPAPPRQRRDPTQPRRRPATASSAVNDPRPDAVIKADELKAQANRWNGWSDGAVPPSRNSGRQLRQAVRPPVRLDPSTPRQPKKVTKKKKKSTAKGRRK